jgi:capsular polysaccharide export protein
LKRCKGAVTVNSTAGLQALYHGVAVCATGNAFYARPGLTTAESLDRFWRNPVEPNRQLFTRFFRYMMHTTQINASFYVPHGLAGEPVRPRIRRILTSAAGSCAALLVFDSGGTHSVAKFLLAWLAHASMSGK